MAAHHHGGAKPAAAGDPAGRDRLHPPRRPQDLGGDGAAPRPERGRPLRPAAELRRLAEVRLQGADHPVGLQQGRVPAGAAGHLPAGAGGLGGDPGGGRLGDRRHQCRRALHLRDLVAVDLRHHHGRLGLELEVSVPGRAALRRADGVLRGLDRLRHHQRAALRRVAQSHGDRRGAEHQSRPVRLVLAAAVSAVRDLLRLGAGGNQPPAVRPGGSGIRTRRRLHGGIRLDAVHDVHARRVRRHRHHVRDGRDPVHGRLAAAIRVRALHLGAGRDLVRAETVLHVLPVRDGQGHRPALSLRPADASGLEGVFADFAGHGGDRRRRPAIRRAGAEMRLS